MEIGVEDVKMENLDISTPPEISTPPPPPEISTPSEISTKPETSIPTHLNIRIREIRQTTSTFSTDFIQIVESGCGGVTTALCPTKRYYYDKKLSTTPELTEIVLPIALGSPIQIDGSVLLGLPPVNIPENYTKILEKAAIVMIVCSEKFLDTQKNSTLYRGNCLFIIEHVTERQNIKENDIKEIIDNVNINGITAMAGPCSIVLVNIGDKYYFYRGLNWPGFIIDAEYLDDVTEKMSLLNQMKLIKENSKSYHWPFFVKNNDVVNYIYYGEGKKVSVDNLNIRDVPIEDLNDVICQLQQIMTTEQLRETQKKLLVIMRERENSIYEDRELPEAWKAFNIAELKKLKEKHNKTFGKLVNSIENMISQKRSSSKKLDLAKIERRMNISSNVEEANRKGIIELIEENTDDTVVVLINKKLVLKFLKFIKEEGKEMTDWIMERQQQSLMEPNEIWTSTDSLTAGTMLDFSKKMIKKMPFKAICLTNIWGNKKHTHDVMMLPIAKLHEEDMTNISDLSNLDIYKISEEPFSSQIRIALRKIISEEIETNPSSPEVADVHMYLYLSALESIKKSFPNGIDSDSHWIEIVRLLFITIFSSSSSGIYGKNTLSKVFYLPRLPIEINFDDIQLPLGGDSQIILPGPKKWWIFFKLLQHWTYTGWDVFQCPIERYVEFTILCVNKYFAQYKMKQKHIKRERDRKIAKERDMFFRVATTDYLIEHGQLGERITEELKIIRGFEDEKSCTVKSPCKVLHSLYRIQTLKRGAHEHEPEINKLQSDVDVEVQAKKQDLMYKEATVHLARKKIILEKIIKEKERILNETGDLNRVNISYPQIRKMFDIDEITNFRPKIKTVKKKKPAKPMKKRTPKEEKKAKEKAKEKEMVKKKKIAERALIPEAEKLQEKEAKKLKKDYSLLKQVIDVQKRMPTTGSMTTSEKRCCIRCYLMVNFQKFNFPDFPPKSKGVWLTKIEKKMRQMEIFDYYSLIRHESVVHRETKNDLRRETLRRETKKNKNDLRFTAHKIICKKISHWSIFDFDKFNQVNKGEKKIEFDITKMPQRQLFVWINDDDIERIAKSNRDTVKQIKDDLVNKIKRMVVGKEPLTFEELIFLKQEEIDTLQSQAVEIMEH